MLKNSLTYAGAQDQFIDGYLCASIYVHVEARNTRSRIQYQQSHSEQGLLILYPDANIFLRSNKS